MDKLKPALAFSLYSAICFVVVTKVMGVKGGIIGSTIMMFFCILFFIWDANIIIGGHYLRYKKLQDYRPPIYEEDYVYGSMKLFMDFILIFIIVVEIIGESMYWTNIQSSNHLIKKNSLVKWPKLSSLSYYLIQIIWIFN